MDGAGQLLSAVRVMTSKGRRLATLDLTAMVDRLGAPVRMVPRRVLLERLLDGFPTDRIRCGSRAVSVVTTPDGVRVDVRGRQHGRRRRADRRGRPAFGGPRCGRRARRGADRLVQLAGTGHASRLSDPANEHVAAIIIGEHGNTGLWPAGGSDLQWWFDLPWSYGFVRPQHPIEIDPIELHRMVRSRSTGYSRH